MSTDRRIRASQQNGAKSHGAVTQEGRLKSSANSARHHLLSKTILLENERPDAFADLLAGLTREFNPQTETQCALIETMAISRWRQMRIWALERATLQAAMEAHDPNEIDPATRVALAFRNLADDSRTLDLLHRYETRFDRQFTRSLNLLMKLADPDNPLRRTGLPACGTPLTHPCPSAEGAHPTPQNDFCQTNLIPKSDTESDPDLGGADPSGAGLPLCAPDHEDPPVPNRQPLTPTPASEASPAPDPASEASHTFVMDITLPPPGQTVHPPHTSQFVANRVTVASAGQSILNK